MMGMKKWFHNNGLSIFFLLLFLFAMLGQFLTGLFEYNKQRQEDGQSKVSGRSYFHSGHFIQATFENWESEFLQMALFVIITISLKQKGSSESKALVGKDDVDREPDKRRKNVPWPVRSGGWVLAVYKHSLSVALLLLFLSSWLLHLHGSLKDENEQLLVKGLPPMAPGNFLLEPRFWFESFQNWQSEFLSVFVIVVFSIFLRQKGSPQSKPVDAADSDTGE